MQLIKFSLVMHRNERRVLLSFEDNSRLNNIIRRIRGSRWSKTLRGWHIACNREALSEIVMATAGYAELDLSQLKEQMVAENEATQLMLLPEQALPVASSHLEVDPIKNFYRPELLSQDNLRAYEDYVNLLQLKAYSASTIKTYRNEFGIFLTTLKGRAASSITPEELKRYMLYCTLTLKLSENSLHSRLNALKFYFEQVLRQEKFFFEIPSPKKQLILPKVLGEKEIARLFNALDNKKHKAILFTAYSAGLRVSEVVGLKLTDIDADRMQIFIENAKGRKTGM